MTGSFDQKEGQKPLFFSMMVFLFITVAQLAYAFEFTQSFLSEIENKYGIDAKRRLKGWQNLIKENKDKDEATKIEQTNIFFNSLQYYSTIDHWGKTDYWATPLEFVVSGGGDCEDFTVAKYFTLLELGVPDEKLLITYVKYLPTDQAHMVLSYYKTPDSMPLILDNINKEILPADERTDLKPIYAFNGKGLWNAKGLGLGHQVGQATDLKRWVDLQNRMQSQTIAKFYQ